MSTHISKNNTKSGMALLISVLTVSILLAIGISMLTVVVKQFKITTSSRDSVNAVYAADAGIECALLWDIRGHEYYNEPVVPATPRRVIPSPSNADINPNAGDIECSGIDIGTGAGQLFPSSGVDPVISDFDLDFGSSCAVVEITKTTGATAEETSIRSNGYNVPCADVATAPNAVERTIKVDYIFN